MEFFNWSTFIIGSCFIAAFFLGRWSIFIKLAEFKQKYIVQAVKDLSPSELDINIYTGQIKFDKEPLAPLKISFSGTETLINDMLEDDLVDDELKEKLKEFKKN